MKIHVIYRACDKVASVNNKIRPFGLSKKELIRYCFDSLYSSAASYPISFTIIGDQLSEEMIDFFNQYSSLNIINDKNGLGNDKSLIKTFKHSLEFPDSDWVYFCEDDYFHRKEFFKYIFDFINNRETIIKYRKPYIDSFIHNFLFGKLDKVPHVIHPTDYVDRYRPKFLKKSFIFKSSYCHWRQIDKTTFTFLMAVSTVKKYKNILIDSSKGARDQYLSRKLYGKNFFFNKSLCISPIPSLAEHMHEGLLNNQKNVEKEIEKARERFS